MCVCLFPVKHDAMSRRQLTTAASPDDDLSFNSVECERREQGDSVGTLGPTTVVVTAPIDPCSVGSGTLRMPPTSLTVPASLDSVNHVASSRRVTTPSSFVAIATAENIPFGTSTDSIVDDATDGEVSTATESSIDLVTMCMSAIGIKAVILLGLQMINTWSIYVQGDVMDDLLLQGMMIENLFEQSQGVFLLLFVTYFFDQSFGFRVGEDAEVHASDANLGLIVS